MKKFIILFSTLIVLILPVLFLGRLTVSKVDGNVLYIVKQIKNKEKAKTPKSFKEFTTEYLKELCN